MSFSDEIGFIPGLCLTIDRKDKKSSFLVSLDYLNASFDAETENGWTANEDSLDISGISLQLGVIFRF
ncbi:MAG: hypothetical protein GY795_00810 [Desulfobacterales bacterium]|nr:hypothetical protein [Desulfobacterales bacterium]